MTYNQLFAFSMALNIPSLLINPFHLSYLIVDLQKKIAELQEAKILHRNFKSALVFLNKFIKNQIYGNWKKLKKQEVCFVEISPTYREQTLSKIYR